MTAGENRSLIENFKSEELMETTKSTIVKYVVQNKDGKTGKALETEPQVYIKGKAYKAGEKVSLNPLSFDAKLLIGSGWIVPETPVEKDSGIKK